jgi:hypothetical protein
MERWDSAKAFCTGFPGRDVVPIDLAIVSPMQNRAAGEMSLTIALFAAVTDDPVELTCNPRPDDQFQGARSSSIDRWDSTS